MCKTIPFKNCLSVCIKRIQKSVYQGIFDQGFCWMVGFFPSLSLSLTHTHTYLISSVQFSCSVMSNTLQPHESQHARPPCPSPIPRVYSNSCPSSWWCHPAISSSVVPFSSCPQSLPASGSFPMSQFFTSGGQSIGASASASVPSRFPLG